MEAPRELTVVQSLSTGFLDGSLPSWLTTAGAGTVTINDAGSNGGYAELDTGTASNGDKARLQFANPYQPDAHDGVILTAEMTFSSNIADEMLGLLQIEQPDGNAVQAWVQHDTYDHSLRTNVDGAEFGNQLTKLDSTQRHEYRLIWYVGRGEVEVIIDGIVGARVTDGSILPDPSLSYLPEVLADTQDQTETRTANVFNIGLEYFNDSKVR